MDYNKYVDRFKKCKLQLEQLHRAGYLVEDTYEENFGLPEQTVRWRVDNNLSEFEKEYLSSKIKEFLDDMNVAYENSYLVTLVPPHFLQIINEARTYQEMAMQLNKENYVTAYAKSNHLEFYVGSSFCGHGLVPAKCLQRGLDDGIKATNTSIGSWSRSIKIVSNKCSDKNIQKTKIDDLFDMCVY